MLKILATLLTLLMCTLFSFPQDEAATARAAAGCGPRPVQFNVDSEKNLHPIAPPDTTKATVYVFSAPRRGPKEWYMNGASTRVGIDGTWVGANQAKSYFFVNAEPGEHRLCADMQSPVAKVSDTGAAVTVSFEAGKTYYFRTNYEERFDKPPFLELERVDNAEGMFLISSSAHAKSSVKK